LGGIPQIAVTNEAGEPLDVPISSVPVPAVPPEQQPARFYVEPEGQATLGVQWGSYCPAESDKATAVRFSIRTLGATIDTAPVAPPGCVSGGDELNLRPLYWMAAPASPGHESSDPLLGQPVAARITDVSYPSSESLRVVVQLSNEGGSEVSLDPCPYYELTVGSGGIGSTSYYYLNCKEAPASMHPGESLLFEVLVERPRPRSGRIFFYLGDTAAPQNGQFQRSDEVEYALPQ
jgi:hypothetical protein